MLDLGLIHRSVGMVRSRNDPNHSYTASSSTGTPSQCAAVTGNAGSVFADDMPMHGFSNSAALTLPANSLLVFNRGWPATAFVVLQGPVHWSTNKRPIPELSTFG